MIGHRLHLARFLIFHSPGLRLMVASAPPARPQFGSIDHIDDSSIDVLVVGLRGGVMGPTVAAIDSAWEGMLDRLMKAGDLRGKSGDVDLIASPKDTGPRMLLVLGLDEKTTSRCDAFEAAATAMRRLCDRDRNRIAVALSELFDSQEQDSIVAGTLVGCDGQGLYRTEKLPSVPQSIMFLGVSAAAIERGEILGTSINLTRRLVNAPASEIYPDSFAQAAQTMAQDAGMSIEIWDEKKLEQERCRALLAVGRGSHLPPRLVILRYQGAGDDSPPLALVGKGVTFDSGGLSIKPTEGMVDMKCDMAGAATVVGAMRAIAKLGIKRNVIGLCGLAENMISGNSYRLGDVIETRSGTTIEILNTDAEGRVVLADTLNVAIEHKPAAMIDLATLTGACIVALGNEVAGLMSNNDSLLQSVQNAAGIEGEWVWPLPMFKMYDEKIKSKVADIKNVGNGRAGGAITAAKFLEQFVGDVPWCHIDIAGPAFSDTPLPARDAGATGAMVRTLVRWVETYSA
jgi:leucyl aminopeptidase